MLRKAMIRVICVPFLLAALSFAQQPPRRQLRLPVVRQTWCNKVKS